MSAFEEIVRGMGAASRVLSQSEGRLQRVGPSDHVDPPPGVRVPPAGAAPLSPTPSDFAAPIAARQTD